VKLNLTIRKGILLLLLVFGLILAGTTYFSIRYSRDVYVNNEYEGVMDDLRVLGRQIDEGLSANVKNPYVFLETAASDQEEYENFSFVLRDSTGTVLAPAFAAGKTLRMKRIQKLKRDGSACMADLWGDRCFIVFYQIPGRPLDLVAVYDDDYVFEDVYEALRLFVLYVVAIYLVLVLLSWFWIIPALERTLEKKQRVESELQSARDLQQKAVTQQFPAGSWFDIHAELRAMKEVGGDIYLCGMVGDKLGFVVGDVSDKGTPAAFMMFMLSSFMRSRLQAGMPLDQLMDEVNELICDNPDYEMFCTLFMGIIDPKTLEMTYCNAGHTKTILNGSFLEQDPQLIAGIVKEYTFHTQTLQLHRGDRLLLYSDGVTEARDESRAFFGEQRLLNWMEQRPAEEPATDTCQALLDTLAAFRQKAPQNDDIAIMCIKI
jgi:hypothetical protein